MQIESPSNLHVHSSFSLRDESALKTSSSRTFLSRISTRIDDERSSHAGATSPTLPSFGMAAEALEIESGGFRSDEDIFKSASAPERSNAFPSESDHAQTVFDGAFASSPAHTFLSMFTTSASSSAPVADTVVAGYTLDQTIGRGGFSTVKKGISSSGDIVAVKRVRRADLERQDDPDECRRQLDNEIEIWHTLNHEHILPLFAVERTADADFFITLFCPAGSLFDILKRDGRPALPQDDAGMLFRQVVRGLRYLHETARLVHGDIKLENILVDDAGMCRITDFGLSKHILDPSLPQAEADCRCHHERAVEPTIERLRRYTTISHTSSRQSAFGRSRRSSRHRNSTPLGNGNDTPPALPCHHFPPGSLPYASPEMLSPPSLQCPLHSCSIPAKPSQDMWALGVLLYALLSGHLPFIDTFEPRLQMKILHGAYDPPLGIGHGAETVLRGCLEQVVSERWTIDMVDEIAWGVGWGTAGDVSTPPPRFPSEFVDGASELKRPRSSSRARPYPGYFHGTSLHNVHGRDGSVFSSSVSRSRSRAPRASSMERFSPEHMVHSPSLKSSFSASTDNSSPSSEVPGSPVNYTPPPALLASRGRLLATKTDPSRLRSASHSQSHSQSQSHSYSRSRSNPESPTTPSDSGSDSAVFHSIDIGYTRTSGVMPSVSEKEEDIPRGRRRAAVRRESGFDAG